MKEPNPYRCDVCKRSKEEGNGWLLGAVIGSEELDLVISVVNENAPDGMPMFPLKGYAIVGWDHETASREDIAIHHLCSDKCALTKQAEYLRR